MPSKKIVVVGDEPFLRLRLVDELTYRGYEVRQCPRSSAALDVIRSTRPQLLILQFPVYVGEDVTLTSLVRSDPVLRDTPILNIAPNASDVLLAQANAAGVDRSLTDAQPSKVLIVVRELIGPAVEP
jgi:CheY-like chemotaxis protein